MLNILWDELVLNSKLLSDQEFFYGWLKEVCDMQSSYDGVVQIDTLISFFRDKITKDSRAFQSITQEGFSCIQSFFVLLNENTNRITRLYRHSEMDQRLTSYSNQKGGTYNSYTFNKNKAISQDPQNLKVEVHVHPSELEGLDGIWSVAVDSNDKKVASLSSKLLIKMHTCLSFQIQDRLPQFEDCFIRHCFDKIQEELQKIESRTEEPAIQTVKVNRQISAFSFNSISQKLLPLEERRVLRYLSLIKDLIKNSEREGLNGLRPHSSLYQGEYLHSIQVQNSAKMSNKYPSKVELSCYNNITLWELRKLIGERISRIEAEDGSFVQDVPSHPGTISIHRLVGSTKIKDIDNGMTLKELKFKPNETLTIFKKSMFTSLKVPLLKSEEALTDKAKQIFTEWFRMFSEQDPEQPGNKVMTPETCAAFTRSCTDDSCQPDDNRVVGLFKVCDADSDGKIQEQEFVDFYFKCCLEKEEVVRQNLLSHGYRNDLKKHPKDGEDENTMQLRRSVQDMPRYKVANTPEYFETVFKLLEKQGEVALQAWNFINISTTNPTLYKKVIQLDRDPQFKWEQIFDSSTISKMLYSLQIVESLLEEDVSSYDITNEEGKLKQDWIQRFLQIGGFQQVLKQFHSSLDLLSGRQADTLTKFEKNFLEFMLRLIRIFLMSAFSASDCGDLDVIAMVRTGSNQHVNKASPLRETESKASPPHEIEDEPQVTQVEDKIKLPLKENQDQHQQPTVTQEFLFGEDPAGVSGKDQIDNQGSKTSDKGKNKSEGSLNRQTEDNQNFSKLGAIMKESGLGETILNQIDFKDLQQQVLEVICLILEKKDIQIEDKSIVENALSLWMGSILRNEELVDEFYKFERSGQKTEGHGVSNAEQFILSGIYCFKNFRVRDEFSNTLGCICQRVKSNKGKQPLFYILEVLQHNFPKEDNHYLTRECKQFFELLQNLMDQYFTTCEQINSDQAVIDPIALLRTLVEKLKRHQSREKKTSTLEDKTLVGYLNLIENLVSYLSQSEKQKMLEVLDETRFLDEIFNENLFYIPSKTCSKKENKCKSKEARLIAFRLLNTYLEALEPKHLADFIEYYLWDLIKDVKKPKKQNYQPSANLKSSQYAGLVNLGCICYMTSMLQQFFMVPQFRYQLLKAIDTCPVDLSEYKGMTIDDSMLRQLQKMYGFLELSERHAFDPTEFCFSFKDFDGNPTNTTIQHDAQEFLNIFFDRVEELLKPTSQKHLLAGVFGGKMCSQLICQQCGNIRNILEKFYNLSLPVKDRRGVEDSLVNMTEGDIINDYQCDSCNQKVDVLKRSLVADTPNVLILHLQRIIYNFDTFQNDKVNTRFEFPNVLNLKDFAFKSVMTEEGRLGQNCFSEDLQYLMEKEDSEYIYKLVGVTIHVGQASHGHYYSLINTKRGKDEPDESKPEWELTDKDQWRTFDDETIKPYSFSDINADSFGGNNSTQNLAENEMNAFLSQDSGSFGKNAQLLVYERKKKIPLKEVLVEPLSSAAEQQEISDKEKSQDNLKSTLPAQVTLECANTAISRDAEEDSPSYSRSIDKPKQGESDPNERQIEYKEVKPFIPEWVQKIVTEDNNSYQMDKQVYHESFFNMIKGLFKHISSNVLMTQHQYPIDYVPHFTRMKKLSLQVTKKVVYDFLAYYYHNTSICDITNSLNSIIQFCDSHYSLQRGDESLIQEFIEDIYLKDNCLSFLKLMLTCVDKTSCFYIGKLTTYFINKAFSICHAAEDKKAPRIKELYDTVDQFMSICISALSSAECQNNWPRFEHFLQMLADIGTAGPAQAHYLLTKYDIIVVLTDFMLGNKSPLALERGERRIDMKGRIQSPPFGPLVVLLCFLIRFSMTPEMKQDESLWDPVTNIPPPTLLGYDLASNQGKPEKYPLSDLALQLFKNKSFIKLVLKQGFAPIDFGKALSHVCFKNEQFTKQVSKLLLKGISQNDYENVKSYLDVISQLVLVQDPLQRVRLEWIFGFGSLNFQTPNVTVDDQESHTKLGVQILNNINDEAYSFQSPLLYSSNDDALLHLLWRYKGRMDTYTVNCLYSLVSFMAAQDSIAQYFSELPGPSYCLARYTDWIKPYLQGQLEDAQKMSLGSIAKDKEETVVKTLQLFETYEKFLAQKDLVQMSLASERVIVEDKVHIEIDNQSQEENVRNLIKDSSNDTRVAHLFNQSNRVLPCEPQPYIIVECLGEQVVKEQNFEGVSLIISQLVCLYTVSQPTGTNNLSIPEEVLRRQNNVGGASQAPQDSKCPKREQEMQAQCINNYFQSASFKDKAQKQSDTTGQQHITSLKQKDEHQKPVIVEDDSNQWDQIDRMALSDIENDEEDDRQDQEGQDSKRQNSENEEESKEQTYKIQVIEEGQGEAIVDVPINQNNEKRQQDSCQIQWPQEVQICQDLVYRVHVHNQRNCPVKATLKLTDNIGEDINYHWPRSGGKTIVYPKQNKTLLLLPKIKPGNSIEGAGLEIDKLTMEFFWEEKIKEYGNTALVHPQSTQNNGRRNGTLNVPRINTFTQDEQITSTAKQESFSEEDEFVNEGQGPAVVNPAVFSQKECPQCTFLNDYVNMRCEICDSTL